MEEVPQPLVHMPYKNDHSLQPVEAPPKEPFKKAGCTVKNISWENRNICRSRFPMPFPDISNDVLWKFRDRYDFLEHVAGVESEWERLLLLRDWVHKRIPEHMDNAVYQRPYPDENFYIFKTLDTAGAGCQWWCPHFSQTMRAVLTACGLLSRHVGNVSIYDPEFKCKTHGVTDVFVQEFGKWVQLDAHYNVHYEIDGIPLSPWEIGEAYYKNKGEGVDICVGPEKKKVEYALSRLGDHHETCRAMWNRHRWNTDPFTDHGNWFSTWQLSLVMTGPRHKGIVCHQSGEGHTVSDDYYNGKFQFTTREADVYPDVGTSRIELSPSGREGTVKVVVGTYTPNFDTLEIKVNNRMWAPSSLTFEWFLYEGENELRVRTRDKFGNIGRESWIKAELEKK